MKAAFRSKYGDASVLSIQDIEKPVPKENEVLIRVYASTANRSDCHILTGKPWAMRLFTGLFKPRYKVTGTDFVGQIESIGEKVSSFKTGDRVMGFGGVFGVKSHAEYMVFPEKRGMIKMPVNLDFKQAAACLEGTFYAAGILRRLKLEAGQKAFVKGATGAIGSANLQILKYYGLYVTAVCGGENRELIRSLGADKIIDYKTEDFTKDEERYDYFFDTAGIYSYKKSKHLLTKNGMYFPSNGVKNFFLAIIHLFKKGKKVKFSAPRDIRGTLSFIKELVEKGKYRPVIDRYYPLDKIAEAFTYVATGQKIGNVVITID
ncbi:MAG TPA: NAD(P)-dependent alcohol dehydrogenase [Chitinophagaceae bacterium]|nr:NAD(P)-dependent alcohol dehydrogenase [Chitinophagaceae bacterium]